ncbi:MAG TPA: hypothetical protein VFA11_16770 [Acidimicrobiales bacterium]|nr:hypothetical protein [Acidimicrobiales bacterium]
MTYSAEKVRLVGDLLAQGLSHAEISRRTGVSRWAIRQWEEFGPEQLAGRRLKSGQGEPHSRTECEARCTVPQAEYAYLLGLYLGDGCLSETPKGVFKLRIVLDMKYPHIIGECYRAMGSVLPNRVGRVRRPGCVEVYSYSKHWPCLFPQHGRGMKHLRPILLEDWQHKIAIQEHPQRLLRGLIHSDGCRVVNEVNGGAYPRYMFSSASPDIQLIFIEACHELGIVWRRCNARNLSVGRRDSVARLDEFIGPKR